MDTNLLLISAEQGGSCGELWRAVGSYGKLWGAVGRYGKLWGAVGNYGKLWGAVGRCLPGHGQTPCSHCSFGRVQAEMVESQDLGLKTCSDKSFFCVPLCRDLPSPVDTLIWANVPSLPNVTPQDKFQPESFKINCKKFSVISS